MHHERSDPVSTGMDYSVVILFMWQEVCRNPFPGGDLMFSVTLVAREDLVEVLIRTKIDCCVLVPTVDPMDRVTRVSSRWELPCAD